MNSRSRQQTTLDIGRCDHRKREPVHNIAGKQIAIRCKACTAIVGHVGTCDQCHREGADLYCLVESIKKRFCDATCYAHWRSARAKERAAAQKAAAS